jgi:predicted permease
MRWLRMWAIRLGGLFSRQYDERDFAEQLEADRALYVADRMEAGLTPAEARRAAVLEFGTVSATTEAWRDQHGVPLLERLQRDVRFAFRLLGRNRGWSAVGIVSLALGAGAGAAVFSTVAATLLKNAPVPGARDLVALRWQGENKAVTNSADYGFVEGGLALLPGGQMDLRPRAGATMPYEAFRRLAAANRTLDTLFAFAPGPPVNLIVDGHGDLASSQFVSGNFFAGLRTPPAAGRPLVESDDRAGAARVAVISHSYWLRRFGGSASIVGKQVSMNAVAFTIVGVSGATLPNMVNGRAPAPDIALPLATEPEFQAGTSRLQQPTTWWLVVMGRLFPGETAARSEATLAPVFEHAIHDGASALLSTLKPYERAEAKDFKFGEDIPRLRFVSASRGAYDPLPFLRTPLIILGVLASIVLIIVCANLTNLSMALTVQRQKELAMRHALGASRLRVMWQILTEHAVMAAAGGVLSGIVAYIFQLVIQVFLPATFDWSTVVLSLALAILSGLAIGIIPAIDGSRFAAAPTTGLTRSRTRFAGVLLIGQVALSLVLLVGAGLFMRTLANLQRVDPGFDSRNVVTFTLDPSTNQYNQQRSAALLDDVTARLAALPGVTAVTFSSQPLMRGTWSSQELYAQDAAGGPPQTAYSIVVREGFFEAMGIRRIAGRTFTSRDTTGAPRVAVVSATLARRLFGPANPIGRRFALDRDQPAKFEVVGVVDDAHAVSLRGEQANTVYWPHRQSPDGPRTFEVRTAGTTDALMPAVRMVMDDIDRAIPLVGLSTQESAFKDQWASERTVAMAATVLGSLALAVSMIGLFGLASYRVARRTKEIAIRMAIGAESQGVLRSFLRESLVLVGAGVITGLVISALTTGFLRAFLFGLAPNDPGVIAAAVLTMFGVALVAGYLPARRASRIDPMAALRED